MLRGILRSAYTYFEMLGKIQEYLGMLEHNIEECCETVGITYEYFRKHLHMLKNT